MQMNTHLRCISLPWPEFITGKRKKDYKLNPLLPHPCSLRFAIVSIHSDFLVALSLALMWLKSMRKQWTGKDLSSLSRSLKALLLGDQDRTGQCGSDQRRRSHCHFLFPSWFLCVCHLLRIAVILPSPSVLNPCLLPKALFSDLKSIWHLRRAANSPQLLMLQHTTAAGHLSSLCCIFEGEFEKENKLIRNSCPEVLCKKGESYEALAEDFCYRRPLTVIVPQLLLNNVLFQDGSDADVARDL